MNQTLVAVLTVASFALTVDLITTYLRKRARSKSVTPEPMLTEEELEGQLSEGVAIEHK